MVVRSKKTDITNIILQTIKVVGILSVALVLPNVLSALSKYGLLKNKKYRPGTYINQRVQTMIDQGLLKKVTKNGTTKIILTKKGEDRLEKHRILSENKNNKVWDKKWRVLIFDIWEKRRVARDSLRVELKNYGFIQLQMSVWIYPYECEEFVQLLKADLRFGKNVRYLVVERVDNDFALRKHFKLQ